MKQTERALGPFVPLLEKTSVGSVFIVQTLEEVILGWRKILSTTELAGMQQHMLTTTDWIPRSLETLDKNHTSLQIPTAIIVPTRNWGQWSPQPIQLLWACWGGTEHQRKHQGRWQRWHLCTSWRCLGMVERSYEANMVFSGLPVLRASGHTLCYRWWQSWGDPLQMAKGGLSLPSLQDPHLYVQKLRLFGLYASITCETSEVVLVQLSSMRHL